MLVARRQRTGWVVAAALAAAFFPRPGRAFSNLAVGDPLENVTLRDLTGGRTELLSRQHAASLFVFFRPRQDHSLDALRELTTLQQELSGKPVRFVAVVSDAWDAAEVRDTMRQAGCPFPVLVDEGDRLYGRLGVRLHPVVGIADRRLRLAAYEPFRQINFHEIVLGRLRVLLGELGEADMARVLEPEKATSGGPAAEARRHLNLARMLWKRGNAGQALHSLEQSLLAAPSAGAYALKGRILADQGRCPAALPLFEAALKMEPSEPVALEGRSTCGR